MKARLALVVAVLVGSAVGAGLPATSARACSCALFSIESALADGTAAFVGTAVDRRDEGRSDAGESVVLTFEVTHAVKGDLASTIEVWTGQGDGDCGVDVELGELVGIVLRGSAESRWTTSICDGVWLPEELLTPGAVAAPTGTGPVAVIATGRSGPAMLASYDDRGDVLAWGLGDERELMGNLRVCPGGNVFVGTTYDWGAGEPIARVVRRDVASLAPTGSATLPERAPESWPSIVDTRGFDCTSVDGDVAFLVSASGYGDGPADNAVVRVDGDAATVHPVEHGWDFAVGADGATGFLITGEHGAVVERFDLADGSRQPFAELPMGLGGRVLAHDRTTGRLAVVATSNPTLHARGDRAAPDDHLVVLDPAGAVVSTAELATAGLVESVEWLDADRILIVWGLPETVVEVVAPEGTVVSSTAVHEASSVAVSGDRIYVGTEDGVVSMSLDGSDRRLLAPTIARVHGLVAVPAGPRAEPQPVPTIAPAPTVPAAAQPGAPASTEPVASGGVRPDVAESTGGTLDEPVGDDTSGERSSLLGLAFGAALLVVLAGIVVAVRRRRRSLSTLTVLTGSLVAGVVLSVSGCGDDDAARVTTSPLTSPPTTAPPTEPTASPSTFAEPSTTSTTGAANTDVAGTQPAAPAGSWRPMAPSPLSPRTSPVSAWTGTELLVWAGIPSTTDECEEQGGGSLCGEPAVFDGAAYDPATDTWRRIADGPVPAAGAPTQLIPDGVWTGTELVVWGGWGEPIAAAYHPATDEWRDLPPGPLDARDGQAVVAFGDQVVVLGGQTPFDAGPSEPRLDGAMLDPATGAWTPLPDLPGGDPMMAPGLVAATALDGELFVVGLVQGDAHVLERNASEWRSLGESPVDAFLRPVGVAGAQWLFAGGGVEQPGLAAVLDLSSGAWRAVADPPTGEAVGYFGAGTDDSVIAVPARWSFDTAPPMTVSWDPATDTWTELAPPPLEHRAGAAVGWTGSELLIWGGERTGGFGGPALADGAVFRP